MTEPDFGGRIGTTYEDSTPWWPDRTRPAAGTPDVVLVLLDDVGYASLGCYGSEIETPVMDALAARGLRYTNFHTTALCSPSRASLLTGRNHHSVGMSIISNVDSGFPSKRGAVSDRAGTIAETLRAEGYGTLCVGKWHLAPADQTSAAGPYGQWPLGRGFDRFYGFLDAATDQFHPELVHDNHRVAPPRTPDEGYTLNEDLVDHAISFVTDHVSLAPDRPYLLYLAPGATHSPHQAPAAYLEKYRGRYDDGWDVVRERRLARQRALGVVPPGTELPPRNPGVRPWAELTGDEQLVSARLQEAYAAFLDHTDHELGRLVTHLERLGRLENTLIVLLSDNGASQEGQQHGSVNMAYYENGEVDPLAYNLERVDDIGTWRVQNNYPLGWAMAANTPLKRYKQNTHAGGVRDPLIVSWPRGIADAGGIRNQFHHVIDVAPTILDVLGVRAPEVLRGVPQLPVHGTSMRYSFGGDGPSARRVQYFEMFGHRALWQDGWKAVAYHERGKAYDEDVWELYHVKSDFAEVRDLALEEPERLRAMVERWWSEAGRYDVLPLDDRGFAERRAASQARPDAPRSRTDATLWGGVGRVPSGTTPFLLDRSYTMAAHVRCGPGDAGVLVSCGGVGGGYVLYVRDGVLHHDYNRYGRILGLSAPAPLDDGDHVLTYAFERTGPQCGIARLLADGTVLAERELTGTARWFTDWAGLELGRDGLSPVSPAYDAPFPFTGAIEKVTFAIDGPPGDHEPAD